MTRLTFEAPLALVEAVAQHVLDRLQKRRHLKSEPWTGVGVHGHSRADHRFPNFPFSGGGA